MEPSLIVAIVSAAASVISAGAASVAAIGIWRGIRAMVRSNDDRAEQQREAMQLQREAGDKRHSETMTALQELIRRTAPPATATERA